MKARLKEKYYEYYNRLSDPEKWYECYFFLLGGKKEMLVQDISIEEACVGNREHFELKEDNKCETTK